jgi:hypothetical protein
VAYFRHQARRPERTTRVDTGTVTEPAYAHGYAWIRPDGGLITLLPLKNNSPYETARDAAREATGLARIMWTAWGGRGKAQGEEDAAAGRIIRDRVSTQRPANAMVCAGGLRPHSCKETSRLITRNHQVSQAGSRRLRAGKRRPTVHPAPTNGEAK